MRAPRRPHTSTVILMCCVLPIQLALADGAPLVQEHQPDGPPRVTRLVKRSTPGARRYVINLASMQRIPTQADLLISPAVDGKRVMIETTRLDGRTWYRVQLGVFGSLAEANDALEAVRQDYPGAWIAQAKASSSDTLPAVVQPAAPPAIKQASTRTLDDDALASLMADGRNAMMAGQLSVAIQIFTKVLQQPETTHHPQAQEYLGLARQKNNQVAHAKAEYERFLANYPAHDAAARVEQRLAALIAAHTNGAAPATATTNSGGTVASGGDWQIASFLAQRYRRDENQFADNDAIVSQSAVFSDISVDARRRGERFDFSSRITAGYRHDLLDQSQTSANDLRLSYAYADLRDSATGLGTRIGRQSRNSGGVLGRFDGINVDYRLGDRWELDAVAGRPVYSATRGADNSRVFYGISANRDLLDERVNVGVFALQQTIDGMVDRQVVGTELRYFSESLSLWGQMDYDTAFQEMGGLFVQGAWRSNSGLTISGIVDRRRSQFLSIGNAMMGQQVDSFDELAVLFTEEELRQLALDRAPEATTMTVGVSSPLTPRLQLNMNATNTDIAATPDSGGVPGQAENSYQYFSTSLVASSLFKQGDIYVSGVRYADSSTTRVYTLNLNNRWPLRRSFFLSPRLRVDYRQIKSDQSDEWIFTPGLRALWRSGRNVRVEFEAGRQIASRTTASGDIDRDSNYVMLGYQLIY